MFGKQSGIHNLAPKESNVDPSGVMNQIRLRLNLQSRSGCQCLLQLKNSSMAKLPGLMPDGDGNQAVHVCRVKPVPRREKFGLRIRSAGFTNLDLDRRRSLSAANGLVIHVAVIDSDSHLSPVVRKSERCACGKHSREARRIQ